ncbi:MAG TPA: hypothetical protein GX713_00730 [Mollicutes bacterium]|nr:hypothetical protein [Mollicutes bacterium]
MKKFKEFYKSNRVFVILMAISIFCVALMLGVLVYSFFNQSSGSVYGDRLNGLETVKITDDQIKEIKDFIEEHENVDRASLRIKGKILYINFYINEPKISASKNIAIGTLDKIEEDQKNVYDISFAIDMAEDSEDTPFPIMGYKKSDNTIISWTNHAE